jgi:hypothetical protein
MPAETIMTCDICGATAQRYRAPFWIRDAHEHDWRPVRVGSPLVEKLPYEPELETTTTVSQSNWVGPNPYMVYLCEAHHKSLIAACETWLTAAVESSVKP